MLVATLLLQSPVALAAPPPEPGEYRLGDYRTPTPLTVAGRPAIDTEEARRLWETRSAVFIDVLSAPRRPAGLPEGAIWAPQPHRDIPGSLWLPDVGQGVLSTAHEAWFRANLARLTAEQPNAALVFYCRADCWMSWNAAKRALAWGYDKARWYRDGIDGWSEAAMPLADIAPANDMPH